MNKRLVSTMILIILLNMLLASCTSKPTVDAAENEKACQQIAGFPFPVDEMVLEDGTVVALECGR